MVAEYTLGQYMKAKPRAKISEYPIVKPEDVCFPQTIPVAFAVCTKKCGGRQFIVDGSTQVCEHCGQNMFRTEVAEYKLTKRTAPTTRRTLRRVPRRK